MKINFRDPSTVDDNQFKQEVLKLENCQLKREVYIKMGTLPVLISAPHVLKQKTIDRIKMEELFTKTIALYLNKYLDVHVFINHKNFEDDPNYLDPNSSEKHFYTDELIDYIKLNNISLVIDLHGARQDRDFDIDVGTLNGKSASKGTIESLREAFAKNGLYDIKENYLFQGGKISQAIHRETNVETLQLEINYKLRTNSIGLKRTICGLSLFIKSYIDEQEMDNGQDEQGQPLF